MHHKDAFKVMGLTGQVNPEIIKQTYRKLCSEYHPDRNEAGLEIMKMINVAYDTIKDYQGMADIEEQAKNYGSEVFAALNAISSLHLNIEICGSWVWVSGNTKDCRDVLKLHKFKWAPKKLMWYFRPEDFKSFSRGKFTIDEIREKYGSNSYANKQTKLN